MRKYSHRATAAENGGTLEESHSELLTKEQRLRVSESTGKTSWARTFGVVHGIVSQSVVGAIRIVESLYKFIKLACVPSLISSPNCICDEVGRLEQTGVPSQCKQRDLGQVP